MIRSLHSNYYQITCSDNYLVKNHLIGESRIQSLMFYSQTEIDSNYSRAEYIFIVLSTGLRLSMLISRLKNSKF